MSSGDEEDDAASFASFGDEASSEETKAVNGDKDQEMKDGSEDEGAPTAKDSNGTVKPAKQQIAAHDRRHHQKQQ